MKLPMSMLFGTILLLMTVFVLIGCNQIAYNTKRAWNYYEKCVQAMEDSHFQTEVMEEVIKAGKKEGYEILIWEDGAYEEVKRYRITLVYTIRLPILSLEKQREISGYAL
ncbi:MAG: hypothetical protein MRZ63_07265 [Anaerostipes sp.]|uniref:hypothetical protein n=1 Tax=Anaerostipes sp. 992a TaxID=1261637 RepID=UPI0009510292|nr:hypothetical protein [Anaerostipes sp. 992a]MCI5952098.1 hypothetical protein [Anaerostipes sp.]MDD5968010.1 hypothetical protein [Anaerostipes sp.]OLR61022.1 hypothetical protein BHF69_12390 [Anaerostipes sp. 992a]